MKRLLTLLLFASSISYSQYTSPTKSWYASTTGSALNSGTLDSPWSLAHVISGAGGSIVPGNTIWFRGGTYLPTGQFTTSLAGTAALPITFRNYPGEFAIFDVAQDAAAASNRKLFNFTGSYIRWWGGGLGLEFLSSSTHADSMVTSDAQLSHCPFQRQAFVAEPTGSMFINLNIHDMCAGFSPNSNVSNTTIYGNVMRNIAFWSSATLETQSQNAYIQNKGSWYRLRHNFFINGGLSGLQAQATGSGGAAGNNARITENDFINNGSGRGSNYAGVQAVFGGNAPSRNNTFSGNALFINTSFTLGNAGLQFYLRGTSDFTFNNNYMVTTTLTSLQQGAGPIGGLHFLNGAGSHSIANNTFIGSFMDATTTVHRTSFGNTYASTRPTTGTVYRYRPNWFEYARCHITVNNWTLGTTVTPTLSECGLAANDVWIAYDAQRILNGPIATGTYSGSGTVSLDCNQTNADAYIGPNPVANLNPWPNPMRHSNPQFCSYLILGQQTYVNTNFTFVVPSGAAYLRLRSGRKAGTVTIDARPMQSIASRPATKIVDFTVGSPAGQTLIYLQRDTTVGHIYQVDGSELLIQGITDASCKALNGRWPIVAASQAHDFARIATAPSGCTTYTACGSGCTSNIVAYSPGSPALLLFNGSPLVTGDVVGFEGGTNEFAAWNSSPAAITHNGHMQLTGPAVNLAPTGSGTVTTIGTAAVFSGSHGLSVNEYVWITAGANLDKIRKVLATPTGSTATLDEAFAVDISSGVAWRRIPATTFTGLTGTVPVLTINRNPLTYDILFGAFPPGATHDITISGHTGAACWTNLNTTHVATVLANGRFSIPVDATSCGSADAQTGVVVTVPRYLDGPEITMTPSGGQFSGSLPRGVGTWWFTANYFDAAGAALTQYDSTFSHDSTAPVIRSVVVVGARKSSGAVKIQ